jgi:transcriptional regulator with XRE-family HTH domain
MKRIYAIDPDLAARLAARRRALGWSQNRLALASGLTEPVICKAETLRVPISPAQRTAIEAALTAGEAETAAHWHAVAVADGAGR